MAFTKTVEEHNVAFPSKVRSGGDGHVLNVVVADATDNGVIASVGAWKDFDRYNVTSGNAGFKGKLHAAANGNWYVEVTEIDVATPPVFLYNSPIVEDQTLNYNEKYFFNAAGDTVKAYVLGLYDVVEESAAIFSGTPKEGATVTVSGNKLAVATA